MRSQRCQLILLLIYPSVALWFSVYVAGFPITTELAGMSKFTYAFGAISTLLPMVIFPTRTALGPIQTSFPMMGTPSFFPRLACAIVTPCAILQFLPILVFGLMTTAPQCPR